MGARVVLAVVSFLLDEVGDGVEAEAVDAHVHPETDDVLHGVDDGRVLVIQVRLVGEEAVPENCRRTGSKVQLDSSVSTKMIRTPAYLRRCRTRRRSRHRPSGSLREASMNHGCWSLVWFITKSVMTRMPRAWASPTSSAESRWCRIPAARRCSRRCRSRRHAGERVEGRQPEAVDTEPLDVVELEITPGSRRSPSRSYPRRPGRAVRRRRPS